MNKVKFNKIVRNYYQVPEADRVQLEKLAADYPYSQVIHTLVAKSHHDAGTDLADSTLHYAAMYTTDRHQLRLIIESKTPVLINRKVDEHIPEKQETDEVMANLATLKANKAAYEKMIATDVEKENATTGTVTSRRSSKTKKTTTAKKTEKESAGVAKSKTKSPVRKGTATKAASKKTTASQTPVKKTAAVKPVGRPKKTSPKTTVSKKKPAATTTGSKGKTTGKKTKPVSASKKNPTKESKKTVAATKSRKQSNKKEPKSTQKKTTGGTKKKTVVKKKSEPLPVKQNEDNPVHEDQRIIIEQFIEKQPSLINKPMVVARNQEDLSVKSTLVNEDLISENLAQIYLNQGKKNKAIEIYKKLIWKFPQKKAYFAARIEELKKKG